MDLIKINTLDQSFLFLLIHLYLYLFCIFMAACVSCPSGAHQDFLIKVTSISQQPFGNKKPERAPDLDLSIILTWQRNTHC